MPVVGSNLSVETRIVSSEFGFLEATIDSRVTPPTLIPRTVLAPDNLSGMYFGGATPSIRFATSAGPLVLGVNGFSLGRGSRTEYRAAGFRKLARLFQSDARLQDATLSLRKTFPQTIYEIAGTQSIAPPPRLSKSLLDTNRRMTRFGKKPRGLDCTEERFVTTVTTEIFGWLESFVTAADQLVKCEEKCRRDNPPDKKPLEYGYCSAVCGATVFEDMLIRTWGVVDTITEEVVTEITHCSPVSTLFATPWGRVEIPGNFTVPGASAAVAPKFKAAEIVKAFGQFGDVLKCLVRGEWQITNLHGVGVDIPGLGSIPLGITVCLDRTCTTTLRDVSTGINLVTAVGLIMQVFAAEGIAGVIAAFGLSADVASIAVVAGVTVGEISTIIFAAFLVLVAHALIVGGQIWVMDSLNLAPDGVCLTYPALPGVAVGILNPVIGFEILANTPIVVTPR